MKIKGLLFTLALAWLGELWRWHGFLLLDLWLPCFAGAWWLHALWQRKIPKPYPFIWGFFFVAFGWAALITHSIMMPLGDLAQAALYGVRWFSLFTLYLIGQDLPEPNKKTLRWAILIFASALSLAGFVQMYFVPDFGAYESLGWDPHVDRLLSTWFDPNFVGGFLAFAVPLSLGWSLDLPKKRQGIALALTALCALALGLTLSRSGYLALAAALACFGALRSWKWILGFILLGLLTLSLSTSIQTRALALTSSIESFFTESYTLPDASARLRFGSWQEGWDLFMEAPLFGQGYNRYADAALELGTLKDSNIHSASGSDSSLLTVFASTGLFGGTAFLALFLSLLHQAWANRKDGYALGFFTGTLGLFVHSVFVNSLLFPLLLAPFFIAAGLLAPVDLKKGFR